VNYSKRIKKIASLVKKGDFVIDIGCDHALLDIYLTQENQNKCIASDINQNALNQAKENIKKVNLDIETVVSDGLSNIYLKHPNTVVIAGMGTSTIMHILESEKTEIIDTLIIQTNNEYEILRKYMQKKGFQIIDEIAFIDKKVKYVVMKFIKGKRKLSYIESILGPILLKKDDKDTLEYFAYLYQENQLLLSKIPKKYFARRIKIKRLNHIIKEKLYKEGRSIRN
jgi:tRNA (adenine22-N1)-methyltransferase